MQIGTLDPNARTRLVGSLRRDLTHYGVEPAKVMAMDLEQLLRVRRLALAKLMAPGGQGGW